MDPALDEGLRNAGAGDDRTIEAVVRLRRPGLDVPGVRFVSRFGSIATCRLAAGSVREVHRHPDVMSLKAARTLGPEPELAPGNGTGRAMTVHDVIPTDIRRPPGLPLDGRGVVIGVVDWGMDFDHPHFKARDGSTRLLALWDQRGAGTGRGPAPFGYGTVHLQEEIDRALRSPRPYRYLGYHPAVADRGGGCHGTHVMGIAAGNGNGGGPVGVAPEADLVFVHLADHDVGGLANLGDSVRLLEAVDFISRTAGDRPWVINTSIGQHGGPHDGTTLIELAFDELLSAAPGRFIVQSTGNYYRSRTHACGVLEQGGTRTLSFITDPADYSPNELEIWYDGNDEFTVHIEPPGGTGSRPVRLAERGELTVDGRVVGHVYHRAHDPNCHDNHIDAFLFPGGLSGTWTVTLHALSVTTGRFHAWLERDQACVRCQTRFRPDDINSAFTTGAIANGTVPLTVGAYDAHSRTRRIAPFSSSGPTRDDRPKPDLCAPGVGVLAARSAPRGSTWSRARLVRKSGTSMAAPHVAGAVALCLQAGGRRLTAQQVRSLVLDTAEPPALGTDRHRSGRGLLDLSRLVAAVLAEHPVCAAPSTTKELTMDSVVDLLATAPSKGFREILYRPDGRESQLIGERFDVLVRPGQRMDAPPEAGDVVLQVLLGAPGVGSCSVLTGPGLTRRRTSSAGGTAGWYATVTDALAADGARARRLLDPGRRALPGVLVLRPRTSATDGPAHDVDAEDSSTRVTVEAEDSSTGATVDAEAAVPPFAAAERARVLEPLLSARESAAAVSWNRRMHPGRSGVVLDDIRAALAGYVDTAAVQAAITARETETPSDEAVLAESVHQFQKKCYADETEHDGLAGESTLDSLGLIARVGPGMRTADQANTTAQARLTKRDAQLRTATDGEFSATTWFTHMADPAFLGRRTKMGRGLHVVLVRKLRRAERRLLTLPAYQGKTPVEVARALGLGEKHGGARPTQSGSTSVHTLGLAIDIEYTANPWIRSAASWGALQRAARLVSGTTLAHAGAPEYFSSLGSDPGMSTGEIWDVVQQRHTELVTYLGLGRDGSSALREALQRGRDRGTTGLVRSGETPEAAEARWRRRITQDEQALQSGDFGSHRVPGNGFLSLPRDLVVALRDHGCLAWGAVDLGPGARGSGDMMHFDARIDGAGRALTVRTKAFVPTSGHPCLPGADIVSATEDGEESEDTEGDVGKAKATIRQQAARWGTDEAAVMTALRALRPADMARVSADPDIVDVLLDEFSGVELAAVGAELARGRVGSMTGADVRQILLRSAEHNFGTVAAAYTRDVLLKHQKAFDDTGTGTIHGNCCTASGHASRCTGTCLVPKPATAEASDCTIYVLDVLKQTFAAKAGAGVWTDVLRDAVRRSGAGGLKGTELIKALQAKLGWEAIFWAPDPRNPADRDPEHSAAYRQMVLQKGHYYGVAVDRTKLVINYRRTSSASAADLTGIERLRRLQFGVLAARGGKHMALAVNGEVYEVHWESPATDRRAVEATPLERFGYLSGTIAAPAGDLALAWRTP